MVRHPAMSSSSAYDFEFSRDVRDALSVAPSRGSGGGDSVFSSISRLGLRTGHSLTPPNRNRPFTSAGGNGDEFSVVSTSMSKLTLNTQANQIEKKLSPAEVAKDTERVINQLVEQSISLRKEGKLDDALESAKQASKKERSLLKHIRANDLPENLELTNSTWFNLAVVLEANDLPEEAVKAYTFLAKLRNNPFAGRVRVNAGNVYYGQQQYPAAIREYNRALDQTTRDEKAIATKIRRNIGNAFFRLGKLRDAIKNFDAALDSAPDFQTGFNLLVCHLALGDLEGVKEDFHTLVDVPVGGDDSAEDILLADANEPSSEQDARSKEANHFLLTAARLIAPALDPNDLAVGYDWVCHALEHRHEHLATQMRLEQATQLLKNKDGGKAATKKLKSLHKKDKAVKAATATNLSFVSFLEGDIAKASEYADVALRSDRFNANALVNKGNCHFLNGEIDAAKDLYLEAIGVQADCAQAIYNLGLANAQLGLAEESIHAFEKVHRIAPNNPQILHQISDIYELQGRSEDAIKWFNVLTARVPHDAANLSRLGQIYAESGDESQGLHYQLESFRQYPVDLDVISHLGSWFVQQEMWERSVYFFQQAALVQPNEIKWGFMVASAYKRCGDDDRALNEYEKLHDRFPDDEKCLRQLVDACKALGRPSFRFEDRLDKLLTNQVH